MIGSDNTLFCVEILWVGHLFISFLIISHRCNEGWIACFYMHVCVNYCVLVCDSLYVSDKVSYGQSDKILLLLRTSLLSLYCVRVSSTLIFFAVFLPLMFIAIVDGDHNGRYNYFYHRTNGQHCSVLLSTDTQRQYLCYSNTKQTSRIKTK